VQYQKEKRRLAAGKKKRTKTINKKRRRERAQRREAAERVYSTTIFRKDKNVSSMKLFFFRVGVV